MVEKVIRKMDKNRSKGQQKRDRKNWSKKMAEKVTEKMVKKWVKKLFKIKSDQWLTPRTLPFFFERPQLILFPKSNLFLTKICQLSDEFID